jgi:predicted DNA-binding ribbon-helix-helix protein
VAPTLLTKGPPDNREPTEEDAAKRLREKRVMKSTVVKRSIVLAGHKTSVSLEDAFWEGLKDIAKTKRKTLSELVGGIDIGREHGNLSCAIRLFVLDHYQARAA